jgi:cytochrome b561
MWQNSRTRFGLITRLLHASIFLGFIEQFLVFYYRHFFVPKESFWRGFLMTSLHKPIGFLLLLVGLSFVLWRFCSVRPRPVGIMPQWQSWAARMTHGLLYLMVLLMPLTGVLMTQASGKSIAFWGWATLPQWLSRDQVLAGWFYQAHVWLGYMVLFLFSVHVLAALKHHLLDRDTVLSRMFFGRLPH